MARPKRGKVIRVSDFAWSVISSRTDGTTKETVDLLLEELHDLTVRLETILASPTYFVLPDALLKSEPEAKGAAILRAVRQGKKRSDVAPIAVKVI